ncbi:MAG: hypothetical protein H2174_05090 [Vampirovibrio sp.]|nr:hypothetical protein [Vampirovibrio sp.]
MMMSQPIQPNINRSALPANLGSQGFISGRQRLQQQAPVASPTPPPSYSSTRNQALVTAAFSERKDLSVLENPLPTESAPPQQRTQSNKLSANVLPYQEIQEIAQKAGYVGVSQRDIDRAYHLNKSLLVDYRA